jgi:hypothetical protein
MPISPELLAELKGGKKLAVSFQNLTKENISVPLQLTNFDQAYQKIQKLSPGESPARPRCLCLFSPPRAIWGSDPERFRISSTVWWSPKQRECRRC